MTGEFFEDVRQGWGKYCYTNGDVYEGNWYQQKRQGNGIYIYKEARLKYEGTWRDGFRTPEGVITYLGSREEIDCRKVNKINISMR